MSIKAYKNMMKVIIYGVFRENPDGTVTNLYFTRSAIAAQSVTIIQGITSAPKECRGYKDGNIYCIPRTGKPADDRVTVYRFKA